MGLGACQLPSPCLALGTVGCLGVVVAADVRAALCLQDAQEFSDVEKAIETLIQNFHQYAVEGSKEALTSSELHNLITQQLSHLMPVPWARSPPFPSECSQSVSLSKCSQILPQ